MRPALKYSKRLSLTALEGESIGTVEKGGLFYYTMPKKYFMNLVMRYSHR